MGRLAILPLVLVLVVPTTFCNADTAAGPVAPLVIPVVTFNNDPSQDVQLDHPQPIPDEPLPVINSVEIAEPSQNLKHMHNALNDVSPLDDLKPAFTKKSVQLVKTKPVAAPSQPIYSFPYEPLSTVMREDSPYGPLEQISPTYKIRENVLGLTRVPYSRRDSRAFTFVFLVNKPKYTPSQAEKVERSRLHILWTASRRMPKEQQFIQNKYPLDVSIARYDDGFAAGEWNVIMPRKKPRGVGVTFMWAF